MTTQLEDQLREVLRDAPEPDWRALRSAVGERAESKRRVRMLRASLGGVAAAAAVAAIAVGAANSALFDGQAARPAGPATPSASASAYPPVPATTAFKPRVKLPNGDYRMPMAFPDVAPKGAHVPAGLERAAKSVGLWPESYAASAFCASNPEAASPQPWGSDSWQYQQPGQSGGDPKAAVTLVGWPTTTAIEALRQLDDNSGACTYDRLFRKVPWPGLASTEGNQFVVDDPLLAGAKRYVAVRRVGDVTVDAWSSGADEATQLATARSLVDASVTNLLASKVLDDPKQAMFVWPEGSSQAFPDPAQFILPAIDPSARHVGMANFTQKETYMNSSVMLVPVLGAQVGDPTHPGEKPVAVRDAAYALSAADTGQDGGQAPTDVVWSSFPDGQKAFDQIIANRGTARWSGPTVRQDWAGHDETSTFLATLAGQPRPVQIALRLEGNVLISVVAQGETQDQARTIATKLADEAAKNLASFGRGPDGRPGNGK